MAKELSIEKMVQDAKNSVIHVSNIDGWGSGFVISAKGHILTCSHVTKDKDNKVISPNGDEWVVPVLARDIRADLAILLIENLNLSPMHFAYPASIADGQTVFALGHPVKTGLEFTVCQGIVSGRERVMNGLHYIQTDVSLNPGNSGGPIVNKKGEVIGVASWIISDARGLGFAVASRHIFSFASLLRIPILCADNYQIDALIGGN